MITRLAEFAPGIAAPLRYHCTASPTMGGCPTAVSTTWAPWATVMAAYDLIATAAGVAGTAPTLSTASPLKTVPAALLTTTR